LIEKEKKKIAKSRSTSPFAPENALSSAVQQHNNDNVNYYSMKRGPSRENLTLPLENAAPNIDPNYKMQPRSYIYVDNEKQGQAMPIQQTQQNPNVYFSSSSSHNREVEQRNNYQARYAKPGNNCTNMNSNTTKANGKIPWH